MPRWLLHSILTVVLWGIWGFIPKKLGDISPEQSQLLSILGLLPVMGVLAGRRQRLVGARRKRGILVALAAGLVACAGNLFFYRLMHAGPGAATVVPLTSLYPLLTVVLAVLVLKEKLLAIHVAGIGLALVSIYFFNAGREESASASWLALASLPILCWGVAALLQKLCTNDISAELSTLGFLAALVVGSLGLLALAPMSWRLAPATWGWGIALGLSLGLGNLTLLAAFAAGGQAAIVSPLTGLYSMVTVILAVGFLEEKVTPREWAAIAIAGLAIVALAWTTSAAGAEPAPGRTPNQA
jgi:drug/metabolite transporter (DMT)-like permease